MKKDYPQANARLAEVAKSWADGEVSHDAWRKQRREIIKNIWSKRRDLEGAQCATLPPPRKKASLDSTMPNLIIPSAILTPNVANANAMLFIEPVEISQEDVLLLAILLFSMFITTLFLVYLV